MKKLTAKKCREQFEQWFRDVEAGDDDTWSSPKYLSREWHDYLARRQLALGAWNKALEIALPILEQQERGEDWIEWAGSECPVHGNTMVQVRWSDGSVVSGLASSYGWTGLSFGRIVAYRIIPENSDEN